MLANYENIQAHEIVVETIDSVTITFLLDTAIKNEYPLLLIGPTGTGKTIYTMKYLKSLNSKLFQLIFVGFSAQTTAGQTQSIVDNKIKKQRKGYYGPPFGMKCVVFIDDLNMPEYDRYGSQPPIELIRQFLDQGGWYDHKDRIIKNIIDTTLIGAMGPPGGGRKIISQRLLSYFNVVACLENEQGTLNRIFTIMMSAYALKHKYPEQLNKTLQNSVKALVHVY